ncbi:MAG: SpoIID/LytB domain-containing protein [Candidatus Riflebacteria bacterium]|nr:SpoIID/LytB domain-containing protein [Candidatus Riflebacteria bacterium]
MQIFCKRPLRGNLPSGICSERLLFCALLLTLVFSVFSGTVNAEQQIFPEQVRIGLLSLGLPSKFTIHPSDERVEIFDPLSNDAIFSGHANSIEVLSIKTELLIKINGKQRFKSNHTLLFSPIGKSPRYLWLINNSGNKKAFRGSIAVVPGRGRLLSINVVTVKDYLRSVVPSEIGSRAAKTALEAQAIAARTYLLRHINKHGISGFDLCDGVHCQAYEGVKKEFHEGNLAVSDTEGSYLQYNGALAESVYHAHCGGILFSSQQVWKGKHVPYLVKHEDRKKNLPFFCSWTINKKGELIFSGSSAKKIEDSLKMIENDILSDSDAEYSSPDNAMPELKNLLYLPENAPNVFDLVRTKSRGHRVGMCQDGAMGMASLGFSTDEILEFYYPGTQLIRNSPVQTAEKTGIKVKFSNKPSTISNSILDYGKKTEPKKSNAKKSNFRKWYWSSISPLNSKESLKNVTTTTAVKPEKSVKTGKAGKTGKDVISASKKKPSGKKIKSSRKKK